jgi:F0F1-type ATP synthase membrane subunit b/b'
MSSFQPERASGPPLEPLPRFDDIPVVPHGLDRDRVAQAFDAFQRQLGWYQTELRSAHGGAVSGEPSGQAVRMDALQLIRAASEFADTLERDAQDAAARQIARAEAEIRQRQGDLQAREGELAESRQELDRQRAEILNAARQEAKDILARASRESTESRHQATEMTNSARAEVERTLEWARAQADAIIQRARGGAEQLLGAALHGEQDVKEVVDAIVRAAEAQIGARPAPSARPGPPPPAEARAPEASAQPDASDDDGASPSA